MPFLLSCAEGNRVLVTDLKSTNGTFIEEEEIEAMVPNDLPLGSEVIFGEQSRCDLDDLLCCYAS
jgi:pSer/pThr/pTyr-binding forkhead associated (FHA) protein